VACTALSGQIRVAFAHPAAYQTGNCEHALMGDLPTKGRPQGNYRSDLLRLARSHCPGKDPPQTVPDKMYAPSSGLGISPANGLMQFRRKRPRAVGHEPDSGKIRPVADAAQPQVHRQHVFIRTGQAWNQYDGRAVAMWYAEPVIQERHMQKQELHRQQQLVDHRRGVWELSVLPKRRGPLNSRSEALPLAKYMLSPRQ